MVFLQLILCVKNMLKNVFICMNCISTLKAVTIKSWNMMLSICFSEVNIKDLSQDEVVLSEVGIFSNS